MTFAVHGLPVARGIAIGRAVLVVSSRIDVDHYFIKPEEVDAEIDRVRRSMKRELVLYEPPSASLMAPVSGVRIPIRRPAR